MTHSPFIGTGHNPEGPDLPLGFGMRLAQEPAAMEAFGRLDADGKARVVGYIQGSHSGEEAENRVESAVTALRDGNIPDA